MPALIRLSHVVAAGDLLVSPQARLLLHDGVLYATTRHDGALTAWSLDTGGGLTRISSQAYQRGGTLGGTLGGVPGLTLVPMTGGGTAILAGGGRAGGLVLAPILEDGRLGPAQAMGGLATAGDLVDPLVFSAPGGAAHVFAGIGEGAGIARFLIAADGRRGAVQLTHDTPTAHADRVSALTLIEVGSKSFLISASRIEPGLTAWEVAANATLTARGSLSPANGLWIAEPTALATATVAGRSYLLLASAGSSSLSVVEITAEGVMTPRWHLIDDRDSRFAGVTALAVVEHRGLTYVLAGGADDGISLFLLLPGGQLVAEAHLADSASLGLANISAIAALSGANGIEIIVASAAEAGLTRLRFDPGAGRALLRGGSGADSLVGGSGHDILMDGAGVDVLTGGPGADLFVLARDGAHDTITDFSPGEDRLNLSAWPALRSLEQLIFTPLPNGLRISYGAEILTLLSGNGRPITAAQLRAADVIGGSHLPVTPDQGHPGPDKPPPPLPPPIAPAPPIRGGTGDDRLVGDARADRIFGGAGDDQLHGEGGADLLDGGTGRDRLFGGAGDDRLLGQSGDDSLYGGSGNDRLEGGSGRDLLSGAEGADLLDGGSGQDRLYGGAGDDRLYGKSGHDTLWGGSGQDRLSGRAGNDLLYGGDADDQLRGGSGHDRLYGGAGHDSLGGDSGRDRLWGGAGHDRIEGDAGNDTLWGGSGHDRLWGGADHDRLTGGTGRDSLWGGSGRDRLWGGSQNDRLYGESGDDSLWGGSGADRLFGGSGRDRLYGGSGADQLTGGAGADVFVFARGDGRDRILDFSRADRLVLDPDLWSGRLSAAAVVQRHASRAADGDIILDFGRGDRLVLEDFQDLAGLARLIDLG